MTNHKRTKYPEISVAAFLRHHKGFTLEQLSRECGIATNTLCRMEGGRSTGIDKYKVLAAYYGVSVDALVRGDIISAAKSLVAPPDVSYNGYEQQRAANENRLGTGLAGERWIFAQERRRLAGSGLENAICPGFSDDAKAGFDLLSFGADGGPVMVEVKSTVGGANTPFYMTGSELDRAKASLDGGCQYCIHRVSHVSNPDKTEKHVITVEELFEKFEFTPKVYEVSRRKS